MKKYRVLAVVVTIAMLLSGCGAQNQNVPKEYRKLFTNGSFDENMVWRCDDEKYSALIERLSSKCGLVYEGTMLVATDDQVIFAGGWNTFETDGETVVNPFTTYEIGSVTKQFTGTSILQQVQKGNIRVDETIDKYFPEYPYGAQITVDQLLHMRSGIVDYVNEPMDFYDGDMDLYLAFNAGELTDEEILDLLYKNELKFPPGKRYSYSNTNYFLLALILEKVTGMPYKEYVQKNIFEPCRMMNSTSCEIGNISSVPKSDDYMATAESARGAGDIHSNVCDILLWDRALMSGKLLDEEQMQYLTTMQDGYSCGWMDLKNGAIGHNGSTMSYIVDNVILQVEGIGRVYVVVMVSDHQEAYNLQVLPEIVKEFFE